MPKKVRVGPLRRRYLLARTVLQLLAPQAPALLVYELALTLLNSLLLGPLLLAGAYRLIGVADEGALGNWELAQSLLTMRGLFTVLLVATIALSLLFLEYAGLILLADAALRSRPLHWRQLLAAMLRATPGLTSLAAWQTGLFLLVALPFAALAGATYWLLLSDADINYYLAERPPRFWLAVAIGVLLALGAAAIFLWFVVRWAFAVPGCVLDRQPWRTALQTSKQLIQGRAVKLLSVVAGWELLRNIAFFAVLWALDAIGENLWTRYDEPLATLVWSTVALLVFDTVVLQLLAAFFAIGLAVLLAFAYEQARRDRPELVPAAIDAPQTPAPWLSRQTRTLFLLLALVAPAASVAYALVLQREFVDHRVARVTAHRAGPKVAPENSLAALRLGIAAGADCAEVDVQQTADGVVVLVHDRDLRRVTGDPRDVSEITWAELSKLRLRTDTALADTTTTDERVPTLAEIIAACDEPLRLNIELKDFGRSQNLPQAVVDILRDSKFTQRAAVSSFALPLLADARAAEPALPVGAILSAGKGDLTRLPVDFLSLNHRMVHSALVRRAHQRGLEVHVWTVNDRELALRLLDLGCDNLITSDPALMREVVDWYAARGDTARMVMRLRRWLRE